MVKPVVMQEKVYKKRTKDIDKLRARILTAWNKMDQRIIDKAVRQWHTRFRACVKAKADTLNTHCVSNVFLLTEQHLSLIHI